MFSFIFVCGFSAKVICAFSVMRSNGESHRNNHFSSQKNNNILHIYDQTIYIGHCHFCIEVTFNITLTVSLNHLRLRVQSLYFWVYGVDVQSLYFWVYDGPFISEYMMLTYSPFISEYVMLTYSPFISEYMMLTYSPFISEYMMLTYSPFISEYMMLTWLPLDKSNLSCVEN